MSQGVLPYEVQAESEEGTLTARGGLTLVIEMMRALQVDQAIDRWVKVRERHRGYAEKEVIEAFVLLLAGGGECLDDIDVLRADRGLSRLVGRELPTADTLRRFLYAFHCPELLEQARSARGPEQVAYVPAESAALRGLGQVNVEFVAAVAAHGTCTRATLDHDATIQESHKQEALAHYKGGRGYQPAVIYWAEQDLVVGDEYRDGNVPAGMRNLPLIQRGFASLPATVTAYGFRADSACYEDEVLKWLANPARAGGPRGPIDFTVSADMTPELRGKCAGVGESRWTLVEARTEESVHCAEVECTPGDWPKDATPAAVRGGTHPQDAGAAVRRRV